jgi:hypothetical protein
MNARASAGLAATLALVIAALGAPGAARADEIRLFSYDPADAATREASGALTFTFRKGLLRNTLINLRSTEAPATADLRRADEHALGRGGLSRVIGAQSAERDVYAVEHTDEGDALIAALCPGAAQAWMAFGQLHFDRDLTVRVIGAPAKGGAAKLCRTLKFSFHGEWRVPPTRAIDPRELERRRFPG